MSGHSKWHNIRVRKQAVDAKKGKVFSKASREIIIAARLGGGDPSANARLRIAIEKARDVGMPKDNIERAIKRGTGELESEQLEEIVYEGYAPGGVALMIEVATDNRNRTVPDIRRLLARAGGSLGETGCVRWMFERRGVIRIDAQGVSEDEVTLAALDAGAEDVTAEDDTIVVRCAPENLEAVREGLTKAGVAMQSAEITLEPQTTVRVEGEQARAVLRLLDELEDYQDVQEVYSNFDMPDEVLEEMAA